MSYQEPYSRVVGGLVLWKKQAESIKSRIDAQKQLQAYHKLLIRQKVFLRQKRWRLDWGGSLSVSRVCIYHIPKKESVHQRLHNSESQEHTESTTDEWSLICESCLFEQSCERNLQLKRFTGGTEKIIDLRKLSTWSMTGTWLNDCSKGTSNVNYYLEVLLRQWIDIWKIYTEDDRYLGAIYSLYSRSYYRVELDRDLYSPWLALPITHLDALRQGFRKIGRPLGTAPGLTKEDLVLTSPSYRQAMGPSFWCVGLALKSGGGWFSGRQGISRVWCGQ